MSAISDLAAKLKASSGKTKGVIAVLAVLTVVGFCCWVYQLINGLGVTGMNNGTSWGLYITFFMFFVGLSAGGLIVASSASVFHIVQYKKVALPAIVLSTVCICCAGLFVLLDLGSIQNIWRMFTSPNPTSPLVWDMCVITCYLIINIVYLYFMTSKKPGAQDKVAIVSRFALPIAILVHSVTAWIFGLQAARDWYSAIMAPLFVVSAMDSGLAMLLLSLFGLNKSGVFKTDEKLISNLAGLLVTCVAIDGFLVFCECLTMAYPGAGEAEALMIMMTGATAPFFWTEILFGVVMPFCILVFAKNRANMKLVGFASVCVVVGVFCKRVWLLFTSFIVPNIEGAPGLISGSSATAHAQGMDSWAVLSAYAPTAIEIFVVLFVISAGTLAFMILINWFTPKVAETSTDAKTAMAADTPMVAEQA